MENILAQKFETIQDISRSRLFNTTLLFSKPQIKYTVQVGILPARKKNITLQTVLTGTLIPFCEAMLGYFGIIDILFSHPVSKLGELKV